MENFNPISERVISVDLSCNGFKIRLINCYGPTENGKEHMKTKFRKDVAKASCALDKDRKIIYAGDFNATLKATNLSSDHLSPYTANNNGEFLVDLIRQKGLTLFNTWFQHKDSHKITWHSNDKKTKKCLDWFLGSNFLRKFCKDVRVRNGFNFPTDHRLLVIRMRTPTTKSSRHKLKKRQVGSKKDDMEKVQNNNEIKVQFRQEVKRISKEPQ